MKLRENIFVTETALSRTSEKILQDEGRKLFKDFNLRNGNKKIGLLVGGDTESVKFSKRMLEQLLGELKRYSVDTASDVLATSSRRTPAWADELLKASLKGDEHCPLLVIANEVNRSGVVPGILGLSDVLVVSGESVSMVSEAIASGKPVIVFMPSENAKMKSKHEEFLNRLSHEKLIVRAAAQNVYQAIQNELLSDRTRMHSILQNDREALLRAVRRVI